MKISNIRYQISKLPFDFAQGRHIKNQIFLILNGFILLLVFPLSVLAHETEVVHDEPVPTVSPVLLVGIVAVLAIGGLILWKFVLRNPKSTSPSQSPLPDKTPPPQEKTVSQSVDNEVSSQSK